MLDHQLPDPAILPSMDLLLQLPEHLVPNLKSLRRKSGFTRSELARALGISRARWLEIERDPASVSVRQLLEVLRLFDVQLFIRAADTPGPHVATLGLSPGWQQRRPQGRW